MKILSLITALLIGLSVNAEVIELTDKNAKTELENIITSDKIAVIDAYATWCGPCRNFSPIFEKTSTEMKDIVFMRIDVDKYPKIVKVSALPTVFYISKNKQTIVQGAFGTVEELKSWILSR